MYRKLLFLFTAILFFSLHSHAQQSCSAGTTPIPAWSIRLTTDSVVPLACYSNVTGAISFPNCPSCSGGGSVAGSDKDVQLNKLAAFGADTGNFIFEYATHRLGVNTGGDSPALQANVQVGNAAALAYFGAFANASLLSDANSHHLWAEESQWNPTSNLAGMAAFATATVIGGSVGASHYASFQGGVICNVTGTASCGSLYGLLSQVTVNGTGTGTTNITGVEIQPSSLSGGGSIGSNFGIHISNDTNGSSNWAIVSDKTAHSYFAGCIASNGVVDCQGHGLTINSGINQTNIDSNGSLSFVGGKGQHINTQAANNDISGTCTAAAATTCTVTFTTAYTSSPSCVAVDATNITTLKITPSTTSLIITTSAATSDVFDYHCNGNPS